jgi:hypothetical protein
MGEEKTREREVKNKNPDDAVSLEPCNESCGLLDDFLIVVLLFRLFVLYHG